MSVVLRDCPFTEEVRLSGGALYAIAVRILRNPQDAEDVCQAAMVKAWQQDEKDRPANLGGWLRQVVINESLQILRRRRVEKKGLSIRAAVDPQSVEPTLAMDVHEEAMDALSALEEPTRTVVVLRLMEGRAGNEVATLLARSPAEISRRLHDGLSRMRARLRPTSSVSGQPAN